MRTKKFLEVSWNEVIAAEKADLNAFAVKNSFSSRGLAEDATRKVLR